MTMMTVSPFSIGENYFIRTATYYQLGKLKAIRGEWLILEKASWIANTGHFNTFLNEATCPEYENFPNDVYVPFSAIIDATIWSHPLFNI